MEESVSFGGRQELFERARPGEDPTDGDHLWSVVIRRPTDFEPYGFRPTEERGGDCSCGCKWFLSLEGRLGMDWGVCANPLSPRAGLLTWEHMGCAFFEYGETDEPDASERSPG